MAGLFLFGPLLGVLTEPLAVLLSRSYSLSRSYMRVVSVALALTLLSSGRLRSTKHRYSATTA